jgi:succinoglycan biosynthesis transport protein ExoP
MPEAHPSVRAGQVMRALVQRWWIPVICAALCVGGALFASLNKPTEYEASSQVLFRNPGFGSALLGSSVFEPSVDPDRETATNAELLESSTVASAVIRALGLRTTPDELLARVEVTSESTTDIASITVTDRRPQQAARIANAYAEQAIQTRRATDRAKLAEARELLTRRLASLPASAGPERDQLEEAVQKLLALEAVQTGNVEIADLARAPAQPSSPRPARDAMIAGVLGILLGVALVVALERLDLRVKGADELEQSFHMRVLARVPRRQWSDRTLSALRDTFRVLAAMLRFAPPDERARTIAVTSTTDNEGKTTIASGLAMAAAEAGQSVLLIEGDVKRPGLHRAIGAFDPKEARPGLTDYLTGRWSAADVVHQTAHPGLSFVPVGIDPPTHMMPWLEGPRGRTLVDDLAGPADLVIVDCPPVGASAEAVVLAARAEAVLFVVDLKLSSKRAIESALSRLTAANSRLLGAVMNRDGTAALATYGDGRAREDKWHIGGRTVLRRARPPSPARTEATGRFPQP